MHSIALDLRYAIRVFRRHPAVSAIAVLSLALGISACSTMFSLVDAMYLRPYAVRNPTGLLWVHMESAEGGSGGMGWLDAMDIKASVNAFDEVAAENRRGTMLEKDGVAELVPLTVVSDNYFPMLGVKASRGRMFQPGGDTATAGAPEIALSDAAWRRYFGADANVVGRSVQINKKAFTVAGIVQADFRGFERSVSTGVWVPVSTWKAMGNGREFEERGSGQFVVIARLRPGSSVAQARAQVQALGSRLQKEYPATNRARGLALSTESERESREGPKPASLLLSIVALLLLIACANVATLLLAQAETRGREISIRFAVGATRWRILRQLLTEGAVLAASGGAIALVAIYWMIPLLPAVLPPGPEFMRYDIRVDSRVAAVTLAICCGTVLLFGLAPALSAARKDLITVLRGSAGRSGAHPGSRLLVSGQAAVAVVLIAAAGMLTVSFQRSAGKRLGFDPDRNTITLNCRIEGPIDRMTPDCDEILARIRSVPGVTAAAYARRIPLGLFGGGATIEVEIPGKPAEARDGLLRTRYNQVSPDFLRVSGTRILAGRGLERGDDAGARVAVVNQTMARRLWPAGNAVGRHILIRKADTEVVGIIEDVVVNAVHEPPEPFVVIPFSHAPVREMTFIVESAVDAASLTDAVKSEMRAAQPGIMFFLVQTLKRQMRDARYSDWLPAFLSGVVGALGFGLAAVGLFGVVLQGVNRRFRELGVRMALGAGRSSLLLLVLRQALWLAGSGVLIGTGASLATGRFLAGLLYGVSPYDPVTLLLSAGAVLGSSLLAGLYPAWKATRVQPADVLRAE